MRLRKSASRPPLRWLGFLVVSALLAACVSVPSATDRLGKADDLAAAQGWHRQWLDAGIFRLTSYLPDAPTQAEVLTVYIEGDGLAWISPSQPSADPSPHDPLALRLALAQTTGPAAYLGRPCQYQGVLPPACEERYWTEQRFAPQVIDATLSGLDQLKQAFHARRLRLVGYSGGAAVAALAAARRNDVAGLITVAGNLDTAQWAQLHHLRTLTRSLNPADAIDALQAIPQWHFAGGRDTTIPPELVRGFVQRLPVSTKVHWEVEPEFDHHCCWEMNWSLLLARAVDAM